jgi:glycosyltransferase involved in cell wall biosynthesis
MNTISYAEKLSIIIPVYNSGLILPSLASQLDKFLSSSGLEFELVLVNDASQDNSWDVIQQLSRNYVWISGINLMRNYGQHNALICGIRAARHEIIITMDDDLQHPVEEIPRLLAKLSEGHDVVYGTPIKEHHGLWRDIASWLTKFALQSTMGAVTARKVSAFRAFRTPLRQAFIDFRGPYVAIDVLLTWGTTRFTAIPVSHVPREIGASNYTFIKLVKHALNMLTGFSTLPLQIASLTGFTFTLFGISILFYVLIRYLLQENVVPGFPFLASIIAIFSGAQLMALGIIGEYLARMHFRLMDRPAYTVRETTLRKDSIMPSRDNITRLEK